MKKSILLTTIIVCLFALATSPQVMAESYGLDVILDGTGPSGQPPWLTATFDDNISDTNIPLNTVVLTMNADNLSAFSDRLQFCNISLSESLTSGIMG